MRKPTEKQLEAARIAVQIPYPTIRDIAERLGVSKTSAMQRLTGAAVSLGALTRRDLAQRLTEYEIEEQRWAKTENQTASQMTNSSSPIGG